METLATHRVHIEFTTPDPGMEITAASASDVKLLISGTKPLINALKPDQITIKLNLEGAHAGTNTIPVTQGSIQLPPGIQLKQVEPEQIEVTLDTLVEKQVPVQPDWTGTLPEGLIMTKAEPIPETALVSGSKLALDDISTVFYGKNSFGRVKAVRHHRGGPCAEPGNPEAQKQNQDPDPVHHRKKITESGNRKPETGSRILRGFASGLRSPFFRSPL